MSASITIRTYDGKTYTNPGQIKVPRNEETEEFYCMIEESEGYFERQDDGTMV